VANNAIPSGGIIIWSGASNAIPSGWYMCNGSNGTPDLRNRFVVGAGSTYAVAATGGSADAIVVSHNHSGTTNSVGNHNHSMLGTSTGSSGSGAFENRAPTGSKQTGDAGEHNHSFTTDSAGASGTNANLPPYYALCYIMKA
jgi:hypothetical protein